MRKNLGQLLVTDMKTIYAIFDADGYLMHAEEDAFNATQHILDAIDMEIEGAGKWVARLYGPVDTKSGDTQDR